MLKLLNNEIFKRNDDRPPQRFQKILDEYSRNLVQELNRTQTVLIHACQPQSHPKYAAVLLFPILLHTLFVSRQWWIEERDHSQNTLISIF